MKVRLRGEVTGVRKWCIDEFIAKWYSIKVGPYAAMARLIAELKEVFGGRLEFGPAFTYEFDYEDEGNDQTPEEYVRDEVSTQFYADKMVVPEILDVVIVKADTGECLNTPSITGGK